MPSLACQRRVCLFLASRSACFAVRFSMLNPIIAPSISTPRRVLVVSHASMWRWSSYHLDIISIVTLTLTLLKRIFAVLQDKEMRPQIFPGVSRWFGAVQLPALCQSMHKVSHKYFDCISRRSRWNVNIRMGANEAWRVVIVG